MIRFAIAAIGIAAGCGRIAFDPRPSSGDARRSDAIPGDVIPPGDVVTGDGAPMATTCIPAASTCNGTRAGGALCRKLASDPAGRCYNPPPC